MLKKLAVVGGIVAVAGLGVGGVASAWSGNPSAQAAAPAGSAAAPTTGSTGTASPTTGSTAPTTPTTKKHHGKKGAGLARRLSHASHAQWVTKDGKTGTFVTHDAVRGVVTAAGTGSVTIKAADGTSETYVVTGSTKVRADKKPATIAAVKVGDQAAVVGTGSATRTATHIVDRGPADH